MTVQHWPRLYEIHDNKVQGCRGGVLEPYSLHSSGCFYGVTERMKQAKGKYPFVIFNGDGVVFPFHILHDRKAQNEILKNHARDWNAFVGTKRSLEWVKFLLSDQSPWRALIPFFDETDPEKINNAGFLFKETSGAFLPTKLLYNFCMAMRFCWEQPSEFSTWLTLKEQMAPAMALFVAMNFKPVSPEISGKYEIVWPWSFLEDGDISCAYRFISGQPATLQTAGSERPNVHALWATGEVDKDWINRMSKEPLPLADILASVDEAMLKQKELS